MYLTEESKKLDKLKMKAAKEAREAREEAKSQSTEEQQEENKSGEEKKAEKVAEPVQKPMTAIEKLRVANIERQTRKAIEMQANLDSHTQQKEDAQQQKQVAQETKQAQKKEKSKNKKKNKNSKAQKSDSEDDMAFLDKVVEQAKTCSVAGCVQQLATIAYCNCRFCGRLHCAHHFQPHAHSCIEISAGINTSAPGKFGGNNPFVNEYTQGAKASTATKNKAHEAIKELEAKRTAKPTKAEEKQAASGQQKKKKK